MKFREMPEEIAGENTEASPLVTVVVPHYNRNALLPALVQNVVAQTYRPIELLIVDDGSDVPIHMEIGEHEGVSIRVITLPHSGRPGLVRNAGIDEANGEYIAFLDSDDVWLAEKLSRQVYVLNNFNDVELVHGNAFIVEEGKQVPLLTGIHTGYSVDFFSLLRKNVVFTSSVMARRSIFEKERFSDLKSAQDYELWLKLSEKHRFYFLQDPLYIYDHIGEACVSRNGIRRYLSLLIVFRSIHRHLQRKEAEQIILRRTAGFYFKLAKHSFLADRRKRSRKMLIKSLKVRVNIHAIIALLLSCDSRISRWAFTRKLDY